MEKIYQRLFIALCLAFSAGEVYAQWGSVEELAIAPGAPTDRDLVRVEVKGLKGDACQIVESEVLFNEGDIIIDTTIRGNPAAICPAVVVPLDFSEVLGGLSPGMYQVSARINGEPSGPQVGFEIVAAAPSLTLSPPTGSYSSNQAFDFTMLLERDPEAVGSNIVSGSAYLSGQNTSSADRTDVSEALAQCLTQAQLTAGGLVFHCENIASAVNAGTHILTVNLTLEDGTRLSDSVLWTVLGTKE